MTCEVKIGLPGNEFRVIAEPKVKKPAQEESAQVEDEEEDLFDFGEDGEDEKED